MTTLMMVFIALILDLILGDPHAWPHPIKLIGHLITWLTKHLNRPEWSARQRKLAGGLTWLITVGLTVLVSGGLLWLANLISPILGFIIGTYLTYTCLSARQLAIEAEKIGKSIDSGNLEIARHQVGMIVGRDTDQLSAEAVVKATVETVAENTSDGEIAPLIFLLIGGPVLGLAYKAVNTLDSMIGYRNEKYRDFGMVAAKLDDVVNYLPARITWLLLLISSWLLRTDVREALKVGERDRKQHLSPNSAFSESVVAGALHLQLGGPHYYFGQLVDKPYIGDDFKVTATTRHLSQTIQMMYMATGIGFVILGILRWLVVKG
ncbi:adenosylcobinamide-phosphate synthase CbiB [Lactobacillus sp. 3B(2020)]|uniref:adenosylcobinamide-phosphate synthase CbiB n=1 Tax=Lactobacillus sp. 3B(2020) TaxID=2695882 RepID=UPI0015DFEDA8|nr:adenosylcobinamide-phosphate synthase CbiB [Lactobacillus sp. 3B(2020)]QLL69168.1 cobalamin biosynthesis protein CobD [Lactobacillus sp. 3B(2020)]